MAQKGMTVRLSEDKAAELEAVAQADGMPIAEAIRTAIDAHIEARRKDEAFQARLRNSIERNQKILDKLSHT